MSKRFFLRFLLVLGGLVGLSQAASAQCAMCKAPLEGNVSDGSFLLTSDNLNAGIMFLFITPYLLIAAVAFFWYLNARKNSERISYQKYTQG